MEFIEWVKALTPGLVNTAKLSLGGLALAGLLSVVVGFGLLSRRRSVRWICEIYVHIGRSIPLLVLLIVVYYVLGSWHVVTNAGVSPLVFAIGALGLNHAAYFAPVYRAAFDAIPQGQWDAGESIGLSRRQATASVILPQAMIPSIPITLNLAIWVIKDSALASLIAVGELTQQASVLVATSFRPLGVYLVVLLLYLAIILPLTLLGDGLERFLKRRVGIDVPKRVGLTVLSARIGSAS